MTPNTDAGNQGDVSEDAMIPLSIPVEIVDDVLEFVEQLQANDDDVNGFMISHGLGASFGSPASFTETSHTGITTFQTGAEGTDIKWSDTDTITTGS